MGKAANNCMMYGPTNPQLEILVTKHRGKWLVWFIHVLDVKPANLEIHNSSQPILVLKQTHLMICRGLVHWFAFRGFHADCDTHPVKNIVERNRV